MVVGGGWAGFGAAYALLKAGVEVTILDASQTPGGLSSGWRTPGGRFVEAGIKGYNAMPMYSFCFCNKLAFCCLSPCQLFQLLCHPRVLGMHGNRKLLLFDFAHVSLGQTSKHDTPCDAAFGISTAILMPW